MSGKSRIEKILENMLGGDNVIEPPIGRDEKILYSILNDLEYTEPPHSIFEELLLAIKNSSPLETEYAYDYLTRDEKILFCKLNRLEYFEPPHSRLEKLLIKWLYLDLFLNIDGVPPFTFMSNGSPLIDYLIEGNTVQTGAPTPENPVIPQGTGERTGNLLDYTTVESTTNATATQISGGISVSGRYYVRFRTVEFTVGSTYTMSWKANTIGGTSAPSWRFHYADNTYSSMPSSGGSLVVEKEVSELLLYVSTSANCVVEFTEIMLNTGSTALPYEPFGVKIPISSANTTTPVYLGEVETTRKVEKYECTGDENWQFFSDSTGGYGVWQFFVNGLVNGMARTSAYSNIAGYGATAETRARYQYGVYLVTSGTGIGFQMAGAKDTFTGITAWKTYLQQQYAAGTPVTVWYVLATEETAVVNEPLMKIGDYADSISYEQTVVSIPTVNGRNTFDVLGDVKPSNVEITYVPRAPLLGKRKTVLKK